MRVWAERARRWDGLFAAVGIMLLVLDWFALVIVLAVTGPRFRDLLTEVGAPLRSTGFVWTASWGARWTVLAAAAVGVVGAVWACWRSRYRGLWLLGCALLAHATVAVFGYSEATGFLSAVAAFMKALQSATGPR